MKKIIIFIVQSKYLALDFHEERKWKRAFASIYAKDAKNEIAERKKKKKIDDLYQKCYSIYFTTTNQNNSSEFLDDNKNELNEYLKPKLKEYDNLEKELNNWKKRIKELENKLTSEIKMEEIYVTGFQDIFSLIHSIINNQEEKLKEMKLTNKNNNIQDLPMAGSLSDLAVMLQNTNLVTKENKNCTIIADKSNINYNDVSLKFSEIIKQVIEEFNKQVLRIGESNINNSFKNAKNLNNNQNTQNDYNNQRLLSNSAFSNDNQDFNFDNYNSNSFKNEEDEINDYELKLNNGLNPSKLILNIEEEISQENLVKSLQYNLEIENCFFLPVYNFDKFNNALFDLNNVEFDSKNAYFKIFPMIENDERKMAAKKLVEGLEPNNYLNSINKMKKNMNIDFEQSTRYEQLTPLQKLIILYGIFSTGNNPYLINCILNVYYPTHCIMYNNDEMSYICKKILEEIDIEYEPNFCNMKEDIFNCDKKHKFFLNNSQKLDIESAIYISEFSDFEYNNTIRKIFNIKDNNNWDEYKQIYHDIKNRDQYKLNCEFNIKNNNILIQKSKILTNVITQNPFLTNREQKKKILSKIVNYLKILCHKIKEFQQNNKSNFNYFTGEKVHNNANQINALNYKEIIENKNKKLNKEDVLNQLREHKNEMKTYSIKKMRQNLIKRESYYKEDDVKLKILSVINSYSENNIKNEWESMRKVWYQNNQRFNPIFKISNDANKKISLKTMADSANGNQSNNRINQEGLFSSVQKVNTNQ